MPLCTITIRRARRTSIQVFLRQRTGEDFHEDVSLASSLRDEISRQPYYPHVLPSQNNIVQKLQSCLGVGFREEVDVESL